MDERGLRGRWVDFQQHSHHLPPADLAPFVARFWLASWDLRGQAPYRQLIVPYPNVHLTFREGRAEVHGVARGHVVRELSGLGRVFGVAFHPGCFQPVLRAPLSTITNRVRRADEVFGRDLPVPQGEEAEQVATVQRFLREWLPAPDPVSLQAKEIVALVAAEPSITRVDELAARTGLGVRQLQRLFAEHVGVGPKWVIRRYRLHEVTERLASGRSVDWAALAAELGYADQAHFSRDFADLVGETPAQYARRYPAAD
ncbi:AraC family transcriptional regulator [Kutzneria albida]|uniref:AraC family transcriptional regulator n=1 Tax=Kutzneria albida TaxID=43357 RepID=UPI0004BB9A42|nr:helix-turn-helix domain-containing protein [Kutzneria albida]